MIKAEEWDVPRSLVEDVQRKIQELEARPMSEHIHENISTPPWEAPYAPRRRFDMGQTELAKYQTTKLISPLADKNHPMRNDMFINQLENMVMIIKPEIPILASAFHGDILSRSSAIERARGKVKLLHKFIYQHRRIYVYELNGRYEIMDTNGYINNVGVCCVQNTDLDSLSPNVEYDISSDDDNFCISYPDQYDPSTDMLKYGINVPMINSINYHTADDSCAIDEVLAAQMSTIKMKRTGFSLDNKIIKSSYPNKIPEIGELIKTPIVFKVIESEETVSSLAQSTDTPVGEEDVQIVVEPGSYIGYFEVTSNEPIEDPILEKYRLEYLDFRHNFVSKVKNIVEFQKDKCSTELIAYYENFKIDKFRVDKKALTAPFVRMEIISLDTGMVGVKLANTAGAKATVQHIYPADTFIAEDGTAVRLIFSVSSHIARSISGLLYEAHLTAQMVHIAKAYKETDKKAEVIADLRKILDIYGLSESHKMFTDKEIGMLLENKDAMPIGIVPYEQPISLKTVDEATAISEKWGFAPQTIYIYQDGEKIGKLTDKHVVGCVYFMRDVHDPEYSSTSISTVTMTTKGVPEEKSKAKRDAQALYGKKATKMDVQFMSHMCAMVNDWDLYLMQKATSGTLYNVKEYLNALGLNVEWNK